jgi:hypothetical protein
MDVMHGSELLVEETQKYIYIRVSMLHVKEISASRV